MPLPLFARKETVGGVRGTLVQLGGIAHFIVEDVEPSIAFFLAAEPMFFALEGLDAYGVMFHDSKTHRMTPLVKVPAANSLVWEGRCDSGSLASAIAQSEGMSDGEFERDYIQPAGTVRATAVRKSGEVVAAHIARRAGRSGDISRAVAAAQSQFCSSGSFEPLLFQHRPSVCRISPTE